MIIKSSLLLSTKLPHLLLQLLIHGRHLSFDELVNACKLHGLDLCVGYYYSAGCQATAMKRDGLSYHKVCKFICVSVDGDSQWHPDTRICKQSGAISKGHELAIEVINEVV